MNKQELKVGFIGLGVMGGPMVPHIIQGGFEVFAFDINAEAQERARADGAIICSSAKEVADKAQVVLTSLPSPAISREVLFGEDGIAAGASISIWVELSTIGARIVQEFADEFAKRSIVTIDAPVSGGNKASREGKLAVMASGEKLSFETVRPILECLGRTFYVGDKPGQGQIMKLVNQHLSSTATAATAEAVALGVHGGLDMKIVLDVLNAGTGQNAATLDKFPRQVLTGAYAHGASLSLMHKDLMFLTDQAKDFGMPLEIAASVRKVWEEAMAAGSPQDDLTTIYKFMLPS
ncbi:NAD(P)-dependent oxidoreductase [Sphingobium naphthae]|nr:NAD(P)-dependent oxidoreductase [Sphingobium naphthae]